MKVVKSVLPERALAGLNALSPMNAFASTPASISNSIP
jgi:hypothetical protein